MSDPCVKTLNSWTDVQTFLNCVVKNLGSGIASAPHGPFWENLTYDQFVNGNVPGVTPQYVPQPVKILVKGDPDNSNIIMALRGVGPLFGPNGNIGQMPADGPPFFTTDQVNALADWIKRECPEFEAGGGDSSSEPQSRG